MDVQSGYVQTLGCYFAVQTTDDVAYELADLVKRIILYKSLALTSMFF